MHSHRNYSSTTSENLLDSDQNVFVNFHRSRSSFGFVPGCLNLTNYSLLKLKRLKVLQDPFIILVIIKYNDNQKKQTISYNFYNCFTQCPCYESRDFLFWKTDQNLFDLLLHFCGLLSPSFLQTMLFRNPRQVRTTRRCILTKSLSYLKIQNKLFNFNGQWNGRNHK
jgi:hypothetical protein